MEKSVLIDNQEGFVTLTINRPKALNAINEAVMTELNTFFKENRDNKSLVGVIITGSGDKAFAAGADIKEFEGLSVEAGSAKSAVWTRNLFFNRTISCSSYCSSKWILPWWWLRISNGLPY